MNENPSTSTTMARRPTKIIEAAENGNLDEIRTIVRSYPDKVDIFYGGRTALLAASEHGHVNIIKYLYQNHADVNLHDYDNNTPLHYAVIGNSPDALKMLLELKADMSLKNKDEKTAPQLAYTRGLRDCVEVFQRKDKNVVLDAEDNARKKPVCAANFQLNGSSSTKNCAHGCKENACVIYEPCNHCVVCFACSLKDKNCQICKVEIKRISFRVDSEESKQFFVKYLTLKSENQELKDAKKCKICQEKDQDCVLLDCYHVICCTCAEKIKQSKKQCPLCRKSIKDFHKIY